jgi:hypothetical protein
MTGARSMGTTNRPAKTAAANAPKIVFLRREGSIADLRRPD